MSFKPNTVGGLMSPKIDTKLLPKFTVPPIPDKVARAFPEMIVWQQTMQRDFNIYNEKLTQAVNGGVS